MKASILRMLFVQRCVGPSLAHQAQREGFADESDQQPEQMGCDRDRRLDSTVSLVSGELFKSFQASRRA